MFNTDYRTFLVTLTNSTTKYIIQDASAFRELVHLAIDNGHRIDVDNVRELNEHGRFVTAKNKPTWLVECLYHEVLRVKQENTIKLNNM